MINITNIIDRFRAADLQAYVQNYSLGDLQFKGYFPSQYTTKLTFEALQASFGAKVMADVVGFDSRAPRKGRPSIGKLTGDIPKVEIARVKNETEINTYRQLVSAVEGSQNPQTKMALIDWMYEDTVFVLDGVNARQEWLSKKAASDGKYTLSVTNNSGGVVTPVAIDFGIPTANRINASVKWSDPVNSTPIDDIKKIQANARAKGYKINYATIDQATMDNVLASIQVQKYCASYVSVALDLQTSPTVESFNSVMSRNGLPQFRVWDSYVTVESKSGTQTNETGWVEGNVNFSVNPLLGSVQWTDTADSIISIDESVKAYNDFVLIKSFGENDPISVVTKGVAYATPVLSGANQMFILKTDF